MLKDTEIIYVDNRAINGNQYKFIIASVNNKEAFLGIVLVKYTFSKIWTQAHRMIISETFRNAMNWLEEMIKSLEQTESIKK